MVRVCSGRHSLGPRPYPSIHCLCILQSVVSPVQCRGKCAQEPYFREGLGRRMKDTAILHFPFHSSFTSIIIIIIFFFQAQKLHEKKEHSTHEQVLDQKTRLMLFKMVDSGLLTEVNGCISTGKESRIYHAEGGK